MKIAVLNRNFSGASGGAERYSVSLVEQLASRHEIHVYAQQIHHQWPGVAYHQISAPLLKPRWVNQLWFATATWWATRRGYDVVHSHENTWHGNVQTVHVLPVKYTLFQGRTGWRRLLRWISVLASPRLLTYLGLERARYKARRACRVVVTSESLKRIMVGTYPSCVPMMSVITPGVVMPDVPTTLVRKRLAREQLGLPPERPCLLFVGNDFRKKGLTTLLAALAQLPADTVLAVVGNSPQMASFSAQVLSLGINDRVYFLGSLQDMRPAYEAADTLVHPTLEDTFGMVVLEAMSFGLPVVVSAASYCGVSGLLTPGSNALILDDPKNVPSLADTLQHLTVSPTLSKTLSQGARDFARSYAWEALAKQQEVIYFSLFNSKKSMPRE